MVIAVAYLPGNARKTGTSVTQLRITREKRGSMQSVTPVIDLAHRSGTVRLAFLAAVVSLVAAFTASAAPIPLYNIYRAEDGFTNFGISIAIVAYSAGTMAGLLVLGRLSNHLGRRLTAIASLGLLLLGCLLLLNVHDIGILLGGRVLMGVGTGLASSTLTSYIVDAAPTRPEWMASVASSQGPMLGLTVGAITSGALVQFGPWPRDLIYLVCVGFLLLSALLLAISPETATPTPGAWRSLLPKVSVAARVRHLLPVAAAVFLATWSTGAFYQALVPALVEGQLHTRSPLILGLVFAAYMAPSALGAPVGGWFTPAAAQRVGMITFLVGMIGITVATNAGALALFIIASVVAGAGQGVAISAATRGLLYGSTLPDRAPIFSVIYLLCYGGATFLSLISGKLSNTLSLPHIAWGYGVLALIATLFTVIGARNPHTETAGNVAGESAATLDDRVAASDPTERISRKTIIHDGP
jgi:MFS family permease